MTSEGSTKALIIILAAMLMPVLGSGILALSGAGADAVSATFVLGELVCLLFGIFAGMLVDP